MVKKTGKPKTENREQEQERETRINEIQMEVNLMPSIDQSLGPCKEIEIVVPRHLSIVSWHCPHAHIRHTYPTPPQSTPMMDPPSVIHPSWWIELGEFTPENGCRSAWALIHHYADPEFDLVAMGLLLIARSKDCCCTRSFPVISVSWASTGSNIWLSFSLLLGVQRIESEWARRENSLEKTSSTKVVGMWYGRIPVSSASVALSGIDGQILLVDSEYKQLTEYARLLCKIDIARDRYQIDKGPKRRTREQKSKNKKDSNTS